MSVRRISTRVGDEPFNNQKGPNTNLPLVPSVRRCNGGQRYKNWLTQIPSDDGRTACDIPDFLLKDDMMSLTRSQLEERELQSVEASTCGSATEF